jgi:serine/threonine protein phosphatase 1
VTSVYACSDVHGHVELLQAAIAHVNLQDSPGDRLILLGDYIDVGPTSAQCLYAVKGLADANPEQVVVLLGNHETDFLDWLDGDDEDFDWLAADLDLVTVRSFLTAEELETAGADALGTTSEPEAFTLINGAVKQALRRRHGNLIAWLRRRPLVHETDRQIFVHAGIDEEAGEHWRMSTPEHVLVNKWPAAIGQFHKTIIAGHVGTDELHGDGTHGVFHDGLGHYYIDGSAEHTGLLNLLRYDVDSGRYESFTVGPVLPSGLDQDRDRSVVRERDVHVRTETSGLDVDTTLAQCTDHLLHQGFGDRGRGRTVP